MLTAPNRSDNVSQTHHSISVRSSPRLFVSLPMAFTRRASTGDVVRKPPSALIVGGGCVARFCTTTATDDEQETISMVQTTGTDDESETMATAPETTAKMNKSRPRLFVNPPAFVIDNGDKKHVRRHTIGVPMLGYADYRSNRSLGGAADGKKKSRFVACVKPSVTAPRVFVNPPSYAANSGRVRKTWGVPMV